MTSLDTVIQDLVIANRILAKEDVVDAYGHVSVRHPDDPSRFLIARSLAPELVAGDDIVELGLDGRLVGDEKRTLYLERFIHAAIFEARPDVMAVVHAHAEDTLAFGIASATKLRPVIHSGSFIGTEVPVWDIADNFGDTNLLVTNMEQGRDLAKCLGSNNVALMRGHGFASAGRSLIEVVRMSVYLPRNARALMRAKQLGARSNTCRRARSMPAIVGTALIRPRPGAPGNIGRTRPVAAICSPGPMTCAHACPRPEAADWFTPVGGRADCQATATRRYSTCGPVKARRRPPSGSAAGRPRGRPSYGLGCACGGGG
jgi:ribulose-5-phosphate 4-epimerase/fuculose-1-phosphate aldolase